MILILGFMVSSVYCASWGKICAGVILPLVELDCLKWSHDKYDQARNPRGTGLAKPPCKIFRPPGHCVEHDLKLLDIVSKKLPLSEKSSLPLVSHAGYRPEYDSLRKATMS